MPSGSDEKLGTYNLFSIGKIILQWGLVVWLLWPLQNPLSATNDFIRVSVGLFLFIVFSTKMLYDTIIGGRDKRREPLQEFMHMIGLILAIVLVVGMVIFFIGMLMANVIKSSMM